MTAVSLPPLSVYVHFPWCVRKCPYCDFNSYTLQGALPVDRYIERLVSDLQCQASDTHGREVISVFLGGGTPSLFSPAAIERVLVALRGCMAVAPDAEVTMEANPGAVERGRFAEYRSAGITRISLGAQSFDAPRLQALGRIHSPEETRLAVEELHAAGIENFNLDLMYALPHQDVAGALADLECAIALAPAHISHYQLTLEPGTVFAAQPPPLPEDDTAAEMLTACAQRLAEAAFDQYEVSAYARPGRQCRHNSNYWLFGDYLGVGAGAHGKLTDPSRRIVRTRHQREPRRYLAALEPHATRLEVPPAQLPFEFMLNALRLLDGFEVRTFNERTGLSWEAVAPQADRLRDRGLLEMSAGRVRPSALGLRFLNDVLLSFLPENAQMTGAFGLSTAM